MEHLRNSRHCVLAAGAAIFCLGLAGTSVWAQEPSGQSVDQQAQAGGDSDVATRVKSALNSSSTFDAKHVNVTMDKDKVVLRGFVQNNRDLLDATQIATKAAGDHKVVNKLTIQQNHPNAP